jgi:pumilio family protein 6
LLLAGSESGEDGAGGRAFAQELWFKALQGQCQQLVGSHADKVLAAFLHCGVDSVMQAATAELQPLVEGNVEAWAQQFMGPGRGQATAVGGSKSKRKKHDAITGKKQQQQQHEPPEQQAGKQQQQPVKKGRKKSYQAFKG